MGRAQRIGLVLGPALFAGLRLLPAPDGFGADAWAVCALGALMAAWWITEAVPLAVTALLPIALLPLTTGDGVSAAVSPYANPVLFLFLGGFLLAEALQRWGLHRRIALGIVRRAGGGSEATLVAGFMVATAFLSLWVSNTATVVMMLPIATSVIEWARRDGAGSASLAPCLLLGVAYAASIGGVGTLVGTPPNALLAAFVRDQYGTSIGFARWMMIGLPLVLVLLPVAWLLLVRVVLPVGRGGAPGGAGGAGAVAEAAERLGPITREERRVAAVFVLAAGAWVTRPLLERFLPGLSDAGIAVLVGIALFLVPTGSPRAAFLLDASSLPRLPWDVLLLFGGGLSLASAIQRTALAERFGGALAGAGALPLPVLVGIVVVTMIFLTELTSNTASTATFLPVLGALAMGIGRDPLLLIVPTVIAASCAFMMPVATPPNAIVFASGQVRIGQMVRAGLLLNLVFAVLLPPLTMLLVRFAFGGGGTLFPAP
jgi:sodium-dependent dicarboxylate transporter 2/3/5